MNERRGMAESDTLFELRLTRNHAVLVLVSVVDRRIIPAIRFVSRLGYSDTRALHISVDPDETRRLAAGWMNLGLSWLPLHIREATAGTLALSVRDAVRQEARSTGTVTVVVPELDSRRWWYPLLHRRSARRIAAQLQALPGVTAVIVPFFVPPRHGASAPLAGEAGRSSGGASPAGALLGDGGRAPGAADGNHPREARDGTSERRSNDGSRCP